MTIELEYIRDGRKIDPVILDFLWNHIGTYSEEEYEYQDNHRFALKSDPDQVSDYKRVRDRGCCGSCDTEVLAPDGNVYLVGFNYGH